MTRGEAREVVTTADHLSTLRPAATTYRPAGQTLPGPCAAASTIRIDVDLVKYSHMVVRISQGVHSRAAEVHNSLLTVPTPGLTPLPPNLTFLLPPVSGVQ
jgi:hypothetical protein